MCERLGASASVLARHQRPLMQLRHDGSGSGALLQRIVVTLSGSDGALPPHATHRTLRVNGACTKK